MNEKQEDPAGLVLIGRAAEMAPQLRPLGARVSTVVDAGEAWNFIRTVGPCVVLVRAEHEECEALRLVSRIRAQCASNRIGVLLLADDASNELLSGAALESGADECMFSPFAAGELLARVRRLLRAVRSDPESRNAAGPPTGEQAPVELRRTGEERSEQAAMLDNAQHIGKIGSWTYNARTDSLQWSDATCQLFGISQAAFRGTMDHFFSFVLPEDLPAVRSATTTTTAANPLQEVQYRIRRRGSGPARGPLDCSAFLSDLDLLSDLQGGHHRPRYRATSRSTPAPNDQAATARHPDPLCDGRSTSP